MSFVSERLPVMGLKQALFIVGLALYVLTLYVIGVSSVGTNEWWALPVIGLMCSAIPIFVIRFTLEKGVPGGMYNPRTQSWAYLAGDHGLLPLALLLFGAGSFAYKDAKFLTLDYYSVGWMQACLAIGVFAGAAFRWTENSSYAAQGAADALNSPSKLAHDFCAYPIFIGLLLYAGVPLLGSFGATWLYAVSGLLVALLWVPFAMRDSTVKPRPYDMHPAWDAKAFRPIRKNGLVFQLRI